MATTSDESLGIKLTVSALSGMIFNPPDLPRNGQVAETRRDARPSHKVKPLGTE